jgi:hypothetical protein
MSESTNIASSPTKTAGRSWPISPNRAIRIEKPFSRIIQYPIDKTPKTLQDFPYAVPSPGAVPLRYGKTFSWGFR